MPKDPMKVPDPPKDPREPFDYQAAQDHFMATGQASDELWSNSQPVKEGRIGRSTVQKAKWES